MIIGSDFYKWLKIFGVNTGGSGGIGFPIQAVNVTSHGSYDTMPSASATIGMGATFGLHMGGLGAAVVNPGQNYTTSDTITIAGGTQTSPVVLGINNLQLTSTTMATKGTGYLPNDHITMAGGTAAPNATVNVDSVSLVSLAVSSAGGSVLGNSYAVGDLITLAGGTAIAAATVGVSTINMLGGTLGAAGTGYAVGNTITLAGGTFTTAAVLTVNSVGGGGQVLTFSVTNSGNYSVGASTLTQGSTSGSGTGFQLGNATFGVRTFSFLSPGIYTTVASSFTQASTTGMGLGATFDTPAWGVWGTTITNPGIYTVGSSTFTQGSTTGSGTGATFNSNLFGVRSVTAVATGDYTVLPTNPVSQASTTGSGTGATFNINAWQILTIDVLTAGEGYTNASVMQFTGGGGAGGAVAQIVLEPQSLITPAFGGTGVSSPTAGCVGIAQGSADFIFDPAKLFYNTGTNEFSCPHLLTLSVGATGALSVYAGAAADINLTPDSGVINIKDKNNATNVALRFFNTAGTRYTAFQADSALSVDTTYIWPTTYPSLTTKALVSDISGVMSWAPVGDTTGAASSVAGGLPYFADTSGKVLAATASLNWNDTHHNLRVTSSGSFTNCDDSVLLGGTGAALNGVTSSFNIGGTNNLVIGSIFNSGTLGGAANFVQGDRSIAFGGQGNSISGSDSYAFGFKSLVGHNECFVHSDNTLGTTGLQTTGDKQFLVQTTGGFAFISGNLNLSTFPNNIINFYSDIVSNRLKVKYKNNAGTESTTTIDVLQVKGDISTFNATVNDRLAVGANFTILQANSAATQGIEWTNSPTLTSMLVGNISLSGTTISTNQSTLVLSASGTNSVLSLKTTGSTGYVEIRDNIDIHSVPLRFYDANFPTNHYVSLKAPSVLAGDLSFTLPGTDVANGLMQSNGSGVFSLTATPSGLTSLGVGNFSLSASTITTASSSLSLSSVDGRVIFATVGGNPGVGLFFNASGKYASITASSAAASDIAYQLPATHITNGLLVNTGSGALAETITPSGLTSIGVGSLSLSGTTITGLTTLAFSGAALTHHDYTANSGSAVTIDPANGHSQGITLNAATPVITLASAPSSGSEQELIVDIIQDGTGGRQPTWSNVTWAAGVPPSINQSAGSTTYISFKGTTRGWIGFTSVQGIGVSDGSNASTGYIGEFIINSVAAASAVTFTDGTAGDITSITLTAGDWEIEAKVQFTNGAITGTQFSGFIGTASGSSTTGQDTALNTSYAGAPTATSDTTAAIPRFRVNVTATTTYYLKSKSSFTVGTLKAYGFISARRSCVAAG